MFTKKFLFVGALVLISSWPTSAAALTPAEQRANCYSESCSSLTDPEEISNCVAACDDSYPDSSGSDDSAVTALKNPLGDNLTDPRLIIGNIIKAILGIVGSLALLMFIYGGFLWITSAGADEKITQGKKILIWSVMGLVLIFFSYMIITFVIGAIVGSGGPTTQNPLPVQVQASQ